MSHEHPSDNKLCDHCNKAGVPYEFNGLKASGLIASRGERLCPSCMDADMARDANEPVGPAQVPARDYITPIAASRYS